MKTKSVELKVWTLACVAMVLFATPDCKKSTPATSNSGSSTLVVPLAAAISGGLTLSGVLAGKTAYLLPASVNPSHCWNDSVKWTGTELFYGISAINWTELNGGGGLVVDGTCSPQPALSNSTTGNFNIYRGSTSSGSWVLTSVPFNTGQSASIAAPSLSGSTMAFIKYEKTNAAGNIYFVTRTADNTYSAATAYAYNSTICNEDNPVIYANGTKMIFESNRATAAVGAACNSGHQTLWTSQLVGGNWTAPVALAGAPALATNSTVQPWVDENTGNLYWTSTSTDCTGATYTTCIRYATPSGSGWSNTSTQILTPRAVGSMSSGDVALIGQFTMANGYAFFTCGVLSVGAGPHYFVTPNLAVFFNICAIPL